MIKNISAEETYAIRKSVLREGVDLPFKFDGDFNKETFHLGAFKNIKLVGIASLMKTESNLLSYKKQYQLRGMATINDVRGLGYGSKIIDEVILQLKMMNIECVWCNAREIAIDFYIKKGFSIIGNPFTISQIGKHFVMYKKIPN
ncbi:MULTISPECIES: GNAT family N-acetyltransferase [Tenacibaculum]|uniref:GNAT family N-acetyltransferase n=1 Tax=Tenacibaculum TaxID=104267 RepID=UPI001F0A7BC1|nr:MULTISPECIES: GNAT family N-acetyltransferase [Tenacibaculum]MCH3882607.1 GNAT family N-acetyltransferase [Tenacibaculum aquimarinum]MDO6600634.1 GNAT family N-acetyltransferase [Tenacibaculum sp. 1_MG-2023]